jgi:hypothetical protein
VDVVAVDANTGQPAWVESKRGCLWVGSRVSKKASRPLEDAGARVRGCGFDEVRLRESSGVVSEVGRSVSKRRQIGSGRDFGSEERTRLFTERDDPWMCLLRSLWRAGLSFPGLSCAKSFQKT